MGFETLAIGSTAAGSALEAIGSYGAHKQAAGSHKAVAAQALRNMVRAKRETRLRLREIVRAGAELQSRVEAETGKSSLKMTGTPLLVKLDNARRIELTRVLAAEAGMEEARRWQLVGHEALRSARYESSAGKFGAAASIMKGLSRIAALKM